MRRSSLRSSTRFSSLSLLSSPPLRSSPCESRCVSPLSDSRRISSPDPSVRFEPRQVSRLVRENLVRRAHQFNLMLDDVSITHVAFSPEFTHAVEGTSPYLCDFPLRRIERLTTPSSHFPQPSRSPSRPLSERPSSSTRPFRRSSRSSSERRERQSRQSSSETP